jgi:hypothetical protein
MRAAPRSNAKSQPTDNWPVRRPPTRRPKQMRRVPRGAAPPNADPMTTVALPHIIQSSPTPPCSRNASRSHRHSSGTPSTGPLSPGHRRLRRARQPRRLRKRSARRPRSMTSRTWGRAAKRTALSVQCPLLTLSQPRNPRLGRRYRLLTGLNRFPRPRARAGCSQQPLSGRAQSTIPSRMTVWATGCKE